MKINFVNLWRDNFGEVKRYIILGYETFSYGKIKQLTLFNFGIVVTKK